LQTIIDDNLVPFEADVVKFVRQLVEGLAYLHDRKIAHLDIKVCHDYHPVVTLLYFVKENRPSETPIQDTWDKTVSFYSYISRIMATESSAGCLL
jgi:serine/threonine protein kinase